MCAYGIIYEGYKEIEIDENITVKELLEKINALPIPNCRFDQVQLFENIFYECDPKDCPILPTEEITTKNKIKISFLQRCFFRHK